MTNKVRLRGLTKNRGDRILHPKTRDRTPSLSLTLSLLLPSLEPPDELIPPQSISSGKSSIDIPIHSVESVLTM
ncbi:hypothetical protein [Coleofasciculus sp. E2-BRE-01]|uniref:hypothetical protein n=1 Tax=Coleofasciculus sp. E2-BRE-01 TaxID=3069524 RepID=UPI003303C30E